MDEKYSNGIKIVYGILGIIIAFVFIYIGLFIGSNLGDKMAEIRGESSDSYMAGMTILVFMILLLILGYLIHKKLISNNILGKFFLYTLIVLDGLYILYLLFYFSL